MQDVFIIVLNNYAIKTCFDIYPIHAKQTKFANTCILYVLQKMHLSKKLKFRRDVSMKEYF